MAEKIFISYNHKDEALIDTVARRLELEFGRNNIFYDKWSMQPGDSIIGKMNEGLEEFTTFFFFVSPNSLESKMVSLEWQTALNKAVNNNLKFVAVRIADCSIPVIISNMLYIDLYGEGMDDAVAKMKCVVKGENTYKPLEEFENLKAEVKVIDIKKAVITVKAMMYTEQSPSFAIGCENDYKDFNIEIKSERMVSHGEIKIQSSDGVIINAISIQLLRPLSPDRPFIAELTSKDISELKGNVVYHLKDAQKGLFKTVPITQIFD